MPVIGLTLREISHLGIPLIGFYLGYLVDLAETKRMVHFRDKSALYGRELKPGEKASWP